MQVSIRSSSISFFLFSLFFAFIVHAEDFKVNDDADTTANATPTIAASVNGKVVVCWESDIISDHYMGMGESEVRGRLFQSGSLPVEPDFQVAKKNLLNQKPDAATDLTGNFVVAWTYWGIFDHQWVDAVSFDRNGNLSGTILSEETQNNLSYADFPSICMDNDGNIVLAFVDYWSRVFILRIDNEGNEVGGLIQVWDKGGDDREFVDLDISCSNASGNFVVSWAMDKYYPDEKSEVYARLYNADGTPVGDTFSPFNGNAVTNLGSRIAVAMDPQDNFLISWKDFRNGNADIYAQGYKSDGTPIGGNFKVNDDTGSAGQTGPAVAGDGYGNFVFCWADGRNGNSDVFAQKMKIQGSRINPLGPNFRVNEDRGDAAQGSPD
ncbi:hypothetical protein GF337_19805, partial [candidate division KSB1 bacterium]|nr:hypothetical protein [candidate division KSB1 bacterium]